MSESAALAGLAPVLAAINEDLAPSLEPGADSRRLFHGRGRCFPPCDWLSVDIFSGLVLLTVHRLPQALSVKAFGDAMVGCCQAESRLQAIVMQRRDLAGAPYSLLHGHWPEKSFAVRKQLRFELSFTQQNAGFFLDIEPLRCWLEHRTAGQRVLNLFAYTCAFSVVALAAGAERVVNIDLSRRSLERGRNNHRINGIDDRRATFLAHDIFKSWGKLSRLGPFDVVLIDPPAFQKGSFVARRDYPKILRRMATLIRPGGSFVACLNAPEITSATLRSWIAAECEDFQLVEAITPHPDFPDAEPERGLKMLVYERW